MDEFFSRSFAKLPRLRKVVNERAIKYRYFSVKGQNVFDDYELVHYGEGGKVFEITFHLHCPEIT